MRALVLILALALSSTAAADDTTAKVVDVPPGDDVIVPVQKGKPAPFDGQLFDTATALRWANWLSQYQLRLDEDVKLARRECAVDLKYRDKLLTIEKEHSKTVQDDLRDRLKRSEQRGADISTELANPSFWKSLEFGLILGSVVTAAGAVAIGLAAGG